MNTKNMLIILFISVISIGLFALYRHINLVNERLSKLESITTKLRRGENVQNRQLQTWLSADEYSQIEAE